MSDWTSSTGGGYVTVGESGYTDDAFREARLQAVETALAGIAQALLPFMNEDGGTNE